MKHFPLVLIFLVLGGAIYMRFQQPKAWNNLLDSLRANVAAETPVPAPEEEAVAVVPKKPAGVVYITPDSTNYLNSGHITEVAQPTHAPAPPVTSRVFVPPSPLPSQSAWTWTTSDGKTYHNVIIEKVEADRVSIFYDQGSAVIETAVLSPDLQRLLNYDPDLAAETIAARQKAKDNPASVGQ